MGKVVISLLVSTLLSKDHSYYSWPNVHQENDKISINAVSLKFTALCGVYLGLSWQRIAFLRHGRNRMTGMGAESVRSSPTPLSLVAALSLIQ